MSYHEDVSGHLRVATDLWMAGIYGEAIKHIEKALKNAKAREKNDGES